MLATEEKVEYARLCWPERDPAEFDAYGTTGQKVVERATCAVYKVVTVRQRGSSQQRSLGAGLSPTAAC